MNNKLLIVDDEKSNLQVIIKYLYESGEKFQISAAPNGLIACKLAEEIQPELILMDWEMPEMCGIDAIKQLKSEDSTKNIIILMISALDTNSHVEQALEAGAMDYIRKPFDKFELIARIKSALKISAQFKEMREEILRLKRQIPS